MFEPVVVKTHVRICIIVHQNHEREREREKMRDCHKKRNEHRESNCTAWRWSNALILWKGYFLEKVLMMQQQFAIEHKVPLFPPLKSSGFLKQNSELCFLWIFIFEINVFVNRNRIVMVTSTFMQHVTRLGGSRWLDRVWSVCCIVSLTLCTWRAVFSPTLLCAGLLQCITIVSLTLCAYDVLWCAIALWRIDWITSSLTHSLTQ